LQTSEDAHVEPLQQGWVEAPHASHEPPDDGHTSPPPLHEPPAATQVSSEESQQPPLLHAFPVAQQESPVAPHAEQMAPVRHATALQHDLAQSPALSALSPLGTQLTHAPVVVSQTSVPSQPALVEHELAQAVELAQP